MADFTYLLMQWVMPGLEGADLKQLNIPTIEEAEEIYCKASGQSSIPDINWYFSYNLFRLAGITQGIAARIREGTAASAKAAESAALCCPACAGGLDFRSKGRLNLGKAAGTNFQTRGFRTAFRG